MAPTGMRFILNRLIVVPTIQPRQSRAGGALVDALIMMQQLFVRIQGSLSSNYKHVGSIYENESYCGPCLLYLLRGWRFS